MAVKVTDTRLNSESVKNLSRMLGKEFEKYRCDEFIYSPAVYQIVGLYVDGMTFALLNETSELDYFGETDDVAAFAIREVEPGEIASHIVDGRQVDTPIHQVIEDIIVINDTELMSQDGVDLYRYDFTAAIIFVLPDRQVMFERDCWFSEDIIVYRGPNVIQKIRSAEEHASGSDTLDVRVERNVCHLAQVGETSN